MTDRPVYIPSRKRNKKQFFHGAFTGGFSAGHFNTVGSQQGWKPQEDEDAARREQKPEDFMDEQDHNEWGGPKSVREEYAASTTATITAIVDPMLDLVKPPSQNVGHRLLRVLGWRDGSTAYVPHEEKTVALLKPAEKSVESLLSSRRLKKIQLQQTQVKLPAPKLDTCGLGYEPYQNAPEFRAHRERRRREAQERAKAVTASSAANRNVYRLSNLLNSDEADETRQLQTNEEEEDNPLVSYETEQSFVGTKTVGGFALHEDDDDVYDDNVRASKINPDEYDTVVYEHTSDAEDEDTTGATVTGEAFGSVFASYATSKTGDQKSTIRGITSDGLPPLQGFVLGASSTSKISKRYPGPDIPAGFELKRHKFGGDEYPGVWQDESHAARQELMEQRRSKVEEERRAKAVDTEKERERSPMAGAAFAGLAAAMKNRFTSGVPDTSENGGPTTIGLQQPIAGDSGVPVPPKPVDNVPPKSVTMQRTTMTFVPESLLCKRFHVVAPSHAKPTVGTKKAMELTGELAYFEREILTKVTASGLDLSREKRPVAGTESLRIREQLLVDENDIHEDRADTRPPMKVLESIFEPESESSESEPERDNNETAVTGPQDQFIGVPIEAAAAVPPEIPQGILAPPESSLVIQEDEGKNERESDFSYKRRRRSRDDDERKRRKRRSRSRSPSRSSDRSRRKRSRKREEKKNRKKRHKSSRRKSD